MSEPRKLRGRPTLRVIPGGRDRDRVQRAILEELLKPQPLDEQRIAELQRLIAPRGELYAVSAGIPAESGIHREMDDLNRMLDEDYPAEPEDMPELPDGGWYLGQLSPAKISEIFRRRRRVLKVARMVFGTWLRAREWLWKEHSAFHGGAPIRQLETKAGEIAVLSALAEVVSNRPVRDRRTEKIQGNLAVINPLIDE